MKTLYLQCTSGCSGDMLLGALLELLPDRSAWLARFAQAGIPRVRLAAETCERCGIRAVQLSVQIDGQLEEEALPNGDETHHCLGDVRELIASLDIPKRVRENALEVYTLLAQAEGQVHGQPVEQVHFHEVGSLDAVADIVGVCWLLEELQAEQILASPVAAGSGTVRCAHGTLPVPAPATAELLRGIPWYSGAIQSELCTPTGAALLKHFVQSFGGMPAMTVEHMGVGAGHKDFPQFPNILRAFLGEDSAHTDALPQAMELCCKLDDMTGVDLGYALERLWEAQPLDVWTVAAQMKKNRPGVVLHVLCRPEEQSRFARLLLTHTTTAGVRCHTVERYVLQTHFTQTVTPYGAVRVKHYDGYGVDKTKPEFADLAQAAQTHGVPVETVRRSVTG